MSGAAGGMIATLMCLVLVGSAVLLRRRRGEPVARSALIWAAVFAMAFGVAILFDRSR